MSTVTISAASGFDTDNFWLANASVASGEGFHNVRELQLYYRTERA